MRYEGEATGAQRLATRSVEILKTATSSIGKGRELPANDEIVPAPAPAPQPPVRTAPGVDRSPSVLGASIEITGTIVTPNDVHIHGKLTGDVRAATLTVWEGGFVAGEVVADTVIVHGTVEGRILGAKVQLNPGAVVRGDIIHTALGVDSAALFEGVSKRSQDPASEAKKR